MIQPAFEILNQRGTPMFFSDVFANIPTAGIVGRIFIRTDSPYGIYRDTGSAWDQIAGSGGGGISGSGVAGQVTFWDGTSSVSGSNNLWFDNASGKFLVGTNNTTGAGKLQVTSATGDDQLRVWGATSPSIRIDNAVSGATQRFVMGLATATNNFIQGSAAGNICISTASANPLLFGMWQTTNASEVMRISTANNLLIGTTTDAGQKLQVSGSAIIAASTSGSSTSFSITDSNTSIGSSFLLKWTGGGSGYIFNVRSGGMRIYNEASTLFLGFQNSTGNVIVNGDESSASTKFTLTVNSSATANDGITVRDQTGNISSQSTLGFFSTGGNKYIARLGSFVGTGYAAGGLTFNIDNGSGTLTEVARIVHTRNFLIGTTTDGGFKLDVSGTGRVTGQMTIGSLRISGWEGTAAVSFAATGGGNALQTTFQSSFSFGPSAGTNANSTFIGYAAGQSATNAIHSNFLGSTAGNAATNASYSNLFGFQSGRTFTGNNIGSNNIIIGTNISLPNGTANSINLGGVIFAVNTYSTTTGDPSIIAQTTGRVSIGTNLANASAILDLTSTTLGFLPPRMTNAQILAISTPAAGLEVYNTDINTPCFYDGTGWRKVSHAAM